jgi:hypothetical protein
MSGRFVPGGNVRVTRCFGLCSVARLARIARLFVSFLLLLLLLRVLCVVRARAAAVSLWALHCCGWFFLVGTRMRRGSESVVHFFSIRAAAAYTGIGIT